MLKVTPANMESAAEWCESYEDLGDESATDEIAESVHRVAAWLRQEAQKLKE